MRRPRGRSAPPRARGGTRSLARGHGMSRGGRGRQASNHSEDKAAHERVLSLVLRRVVGAGI